MRLIILAAGQGTRLRPLTENCPKCLVPLMGKTLLEWQLQAAKQAGIKEIYVVGGHCLEKMRSYRVNIIENQDYKNTNMLYSLFCAEEFFRDNEFIFSYGDIVYSSSVITQLLTCAQPISVVVDRDWRSYWEARFTNPLDDAESLQLDPDGKIVDIGNKVSNINEIQGQYIGLVKFTKEGAKLLKKAYDNLNEKAKKISMTEMLQHMINNGKPIQAVSINGNWLEIDSLPDLRVGEQYLKNGRIKVEYEESISVLG